MKKVMKKYAASVVAGLLLSWTLCAQAQPTGVEVNANALLLPDESALQATMYPLMQLLQGPVLVVKYIKPASFVKADAFTGGGFIVGVYVGKEVLDNIKSPLLVIDQKEVKAVTDLNYFSQYDPKKTGQLSEKTLRDGRFVLLYYNTNGYLLMLSMVNYGVHGLQYDVANNNVKLILDGLQRDKFLQGLIINFKADPVPAKPAGPQTGLAPQTGLGSQNVAGSQTVGGPANVAGPQNVVGPQNPVAAQTAAAPQNVVAPQNPI